MMKKAAIIIASGFEEGEALTIADIIKRAHLQLSLIHIFLQLHPPNFNTLPVNLLL